MNSKIKKIQEEFDQLYLNFDKIAEPILEDKALATMHSVFNLYEIEPFFGELSREDIDPNRPILIESEDDFNPEKDDLYEYRINLETRKVMHRKLLLGGSTSYDTVFEYNEDYYKSSTTFINDEGRKSIKICYLYFKDGVAHQYFECSQYGLFYRTFQSEDGKLLGYHTEWPGSEGHIQGSYIYGPEGQLNKIKETTPKGYTSILFEAGIMEEARESVLEKIENFLVEQIAGAIEQKVRIEEKVYCILLEYTMQHPFPPTVALGLESELEDEFEKTELWELYNAPDMHYFSEREDDVLPIDFHAEEIQSSFLYTDKYTEGLHWDDERAHETWASEVFEVYLRVCKRLMHMNFSMAFTKSPNFLIMAKEFEQCNEEDFYKLLSTYKKEQGL